MFYILSICYSGFAVIETVLNLPWIMQALAAPGFKYPPQRKIVLPENKRLWEFINHIFN
jgi:hypothetical protein